MTELLFCRQNLTTAHTSFLRIRKFAISRIFIILYADYFVNNLFGFYTPNSKLFFDIINIIKFRRGERMNIGEQIKKLRTAKKMTQSELAEKINVTKATVSAYENGTRQPSYEVLIKIAELFRVSTDNLLGYSNKYTIDVTSLNQQQRNTISEVVSVYRRHNWMYKDIMGGDSVEQLLKDMGYIDKLEEDWFHKEVTRKKTEDDDDNAENNEL
jgi:transcriptional regulator with XRE-family HTH domain